MMQPDYPQSLAFLERWCPEGPWVLIATSVERDVLPIVRTFTPQDEEGDDALAFLEKYGAEKNLYFSVNPTRRPMFKKASREDIREMAWLHVDLDPAKKIPEGVDAATFVTQERERLLAQLQGASPPPTVVVDSGGGYWGFWKLKEPFQIEGAKDRYEDAARYNKQLEIDFDADHCHNVDRIARLPGTLNRPDELKRAAGRELALSTLLEWDDERVYDLDEFHAAAPKAEAQSGLVEIHEGFVLADVEDLPDDVPQLCKIVIVQGNDPEHPDRWESRSEALYWICCELVRRGCSDDEIYGAITNKAHGISDHVYAQTNPQKYAIRQIEQAKENAIQPELREMNERHAVIQNVNGKCRVLSEVPDPDMKRPELTFQTFDDLKNGYLNRSVEVVTTDAKGNPVPKSVALGTWWLTHPNRRQYQTVVFSPGGDVQGCFNLWRGFAYDARPGSCEVYLDHVRRNVCGDSDELYTYVIGWMARAVQEPDTPGEVAIVLRGGRGVGKGKFAGTIKRLFGRHGVQVTNPEHLTGKFNSHLRDCVLLFGDEAFAARDKRHESVLKGLVTESHLISEQKGYDAKPARNYTHIILASNAKWVVPAGEDERRFLVLDVGEENKKDRTYFGALQAELNAGGYEALLYTLLNHDLSDYDVGTVPETQALLEQKILSMSPLEEWWLSMLQDGTMTEEGWPRLIVKQNLRHLFTTYCRAYGIPARSNDNIFHEFVGRVLPGGANTVRASGRKVVIQADGTTAEIDRPRCYKLPALESCRHQFSGIFGGGLEWADTVDEPVVDEAF